MTLAEEKQLVVERFGLDIVWMLPDVGSKFTEPYINIFEEEVEFVPEKGGYSLAKVLGYLDDEQRKSLFNKMPYSLRIATGATKFLIIEQNFWFQNPGNAPQIWKAIVEVIQEEPVNPNTKEENEH